ncbi:methyl-accepting chemotaxis sensory transducer [Candidatus Vecturithrix granuli]|uniref:Methyl-accepting chemotaxis sensory transducer n=1 Tax=Vecturithrix granuli TaxID=1499967 RepID=A0A081BWJ1_VECG1|nr:methyl-accepting chemotaxis sensory transducer [Candidatus Vecturithrix granuli]
MKMSIQKKLFMLCILLVVLTAGSISIAYYHLARKDVHQESQQRIQIAFDILLDDFENRLKFSYDRIEDFLKGNSTLSSVMQLSLENQEQLSSAYFIVSNLVRVVEELKRLGENIAATNIALYTLDKRLLAVSLEGEEQEISGVYVHSKDGQDIFLRTNDPEKPISAILSDEDAVVAYPLPPSISAQYHGDIPDTLMTSPFSTEYLFGIQVIAPVYRTQQKIGVLVAEIAYTQSIVERYASLSKTEINLYIADQFNVGTLPEQGHLDPELLKQSASCEELLSGAWAMTITSIFVKEQNFYQGSCLFHNSSGQPVGTMAISLSKQIEYEEIREVLSIVLLVAAIVMGVAMGFAMLFSRGTIRSIHTIVSVIGAAAEGDLRRTVTVITTDEIGMLATKLNQMIAQLRTISGQVQGSTHEVNNTADVILHEIHTLIQHIEQQSASVNMVTSSVEKITQFIIMVAQNSIALLNSAEQILVSIQETRASINEVNTSTGLMTTDLHRISSSVDQVNRSVKQIAENAQTLANNARRTETEIHHIDNSLQEFSQNADQNLSLAEETRTVALKAQSSVAASIQGMNELKEATADTARIIQEVKMLSEQVSVILDIVDDITEQTSLLSLNASIISAQAGAHGRGFAVVAEEIKNLAIRTKSSTKEIDTLIRQFQQKAEEGVKRTEMGSKKAEEGLQLANAVKVALAQILDSATRSSSGAANTAQVVQHTATSSQIIKTSMSEITEMVAHIHKAIQAQEQEVEHALSAIESISGMSEQVTHAGLEQRKAAEQIEHGMEDATEKFTTISEQTKTLKQDSLQIVEAMYTIESTTKQILQNANSISGKSVKNLITQAEVLQQVVNIFKVK